MPRNQCAICHLVVARPTDLPRHMKTHLSPEERAALMFQCRYCDYSALQRSNLITHEHIHTGGKPHECPDCTLAYTDPGSLTRHRKKFHGYVPAQRVAKKSKASRRAAPYKRPVEIGPSPSSSATVSPVTSDDGQLDPSFVWDKSFTEPLSEKEQAALAELCSSFPPLGTASIMGSMSQPQDLILPATSHSPGNKENQYDLLPDDWILTTMLPEHAANVPKTPMSATNPREGHLGMEWNSLLDVTQTYDNATNTVSASAGFSNVDPNTNSGFISLQDLGLSFLEPLDTTNAILDTSPSIPPLFYPMAHPPNTVQYPTVQASNYHLDTTNEYTNLPHTFVPTLPNYSIPASFPSYDLDPALHMNQGLVADPLAVYPQEYTQYPCFI